MARSQQPELHHGTLEAVLLRALRRGADHGYGLARAIELASGKALTIEEGSLYPALYRLEKRGDVEAEWRATGNDGRAKVYSLTSKGRRKTDERVALWERLSGAGVLVGGRA